MAESVNASGLLGQRCKREAGMSSSRDSLSVACLLVVGLLVSPASAEQAENSVACGPRLDWALPPPPASARRVIHTAPSPLCPEGQVPLPVERYAPKGRPGKGTFSPLKNGNTTATVTFHYAGVFQFVPVSGASALWGQYQPTLASADSHSLAEMSVESEDDEQIVEVGWTVDRGVNRDALPHLFVFHWVDGKPGCYNGCGWQQVSPTRYPGMVVELTREPQQVIFRYFNSGWWVWYQSEWIGFFPGGLWAVDFSTAGLVQWFGEIAGQVQPISQMGDGLLPSQADAAFMQDLEVEGDSGDSQAASVTVNTVTDPQTYQLTIMDAGFAFGGPGYGNPVAECATCASRLANCGVVPDTCGNSLSCGTCSFLETCGGHGQANVCVLPDGGMGGRPWEGGYFDGGASVVVDAGTPDSGPSNPNASGGSGCSSSGASGSLFLLALSGSTLGLGRWFRRGQRKPRRPKRREQPSGAHRFDVRPPPRG
jgi:hypothetical protein